MSFVLIWGLVLSARADVNLNVAIQHGYDFFYPSITLDGTPLPESMHRVESPGGLFWRNFSETNSDWSGFFLTNDLSVIVHEMTNGLWRLYLNKDTPGETVHQFKVSMDGIVPEVFGDVMIHNPPDRAAGVSSQPTFHWTGPSNMQSLYVSVSDENSTVSYSPGPIPSGQTNWTAPGPLLAGQNNFYVTYDWRGFPGIVISTPTNLMGEALAGWTAQGDIRTYGISAFFVAGGGTAGHTCVAHYDFEDDSALTTDASGNGNDIETYVTSNGGTVSVITESASGDFAIALDTNDGAGAGWLTTPPSVLQALTGSFSVSVRVKTEQVSGEDDDSGMFGNAGIVSGFNGPGERWVVPMALAGSKLAFVTAGSEWDTLHSTVAINTGEFVHIVVTRDQATGVKRIYINGELNAEGMGTTELLDGGEVIELGSNNGVGLQGIMDDIQIYTGVLSASAVQFLYENPGERVPDIGGSQLGDAVDAPGFLWSTGGSGEWFRQTEITHDGQDAAQSGSIGDDQETWIETTVTGPGTLTFWWKISSEDVLDFLEFTMNNEAYDSISGDSGWVQVAVPLDAGVHTLRWTYWKDSAGSDLMDSAFLDGVTFLADAPPVQFSLTLRREQRSLLNSFFPGEITFVAFPSLWSPEEPLTYHRVESPDDTFSATYGSETGASSVVFSSFEQFRNAVEGEWKLWLNRDSGQEMVFTFNVAVGALESNSFEHVQITSPPDGGSGVSPAPHYAWIGPSGWADLNVRVFRHGSAGEVTHAGDALTSHITVWTNSVVLPPSTNYFSVRYNTPVTTISVESPFEDFLVSQIELESAALSGFIVSPSQPVILLPQAAGTNVQISFMSETGFTYVLLSRTNLSAGAWETNALISGDGAWKNYTVPRTNSQRYFRVSTFKE